MPDSPVHPHMAADLDAVDAALDGRPVDPDRRTLAELAVLLRDDRPAPDAEAGRRLDERLAVSLRGAHGRATGRRRRGLRSVAARSRWTWWPALGAIACVLLAAVVVFDELRGAGRFDRVTSTADEAGGGGAAGGAEGQTAGRAQEEAAVERELAEPSAGSGEESSASTDLSTPGGSLSDPTDGDERRLVERSAFLTLTTKPTELADVASRIVRTTDDAGGYVASSTVGETAGERSGASFELRVPARELARTLAALSRLAQVTERSESTRDVTADAGRTARRVAELRAERRGLLRALERAESARESARIRARLRVVARRTAAARAAGQRLRARAAFATISVNLVSDDDAGAAAGDGRWTPGDAVRTALRVLEVALGVAVVAAALAVPLAIAVAALLLGSRVVGRRRRRVVDAG